MKTAVRPLVLALALLSLFSLLLLSSKSTPFSSSRSSLSLIAAAACLKVFVADLPRALNHGILDEYWSLSGPDSRIGVDPDAALRPVVAAASSGRKPYPENPLIKQYSAEYWLLADLETRDRGSVAERVYDLDAADVVFVPFFATLSAEMELGWGRKGGFLKKDEGNGDYRRQREVVNRIRASEAWRRSGGRDHVFVLTDPVAMWHVRNDIAPAILLVVDFGGWYKTDSKASGNTSGRIQHTQVSLLKDVIVPYTHLLPSLQLSENRHRHILLYFKGAKHRHRGGLVREKIWDILVNEPGVVVEEGFPNATGREQSIKGMRSSEFCLHPAGDTPTSCRLFDAIFSLCIPVIVSDEIELPFEGMVDYSDFSVFVPVSKALQPKWLVTYLRNISKQQKDIFRSNMARVQPMFEYENAGPNSTGSTPLGSAVNHIWRKIYHKVPMIKEAMMREKRKPEGVSRPLRCHCT
ncbi:putative arabinosyltransferase ARAD1 [Curcuma longa]|uniref:putative arabinosyltransferase ARAD1 n=1 Tax=Curcuma longa TaxID=136217 RepID=UPI003D9F9BC9